MNIFRDIRYIKRILQNMLILSRGKSLPSISLPLWIVLFKRKWQEKKKKKRTPLAYAIQAGKKTRVALYYSITINRDL